MELFEARLLNPLPIQILMQPTFEHLPYGNSLTRESLEDNESCIPAILTEFILVG